MFIIANFIEALARIIGIVLNLYMWIIVIRAVISWFSPDPYNPFMQFLYRVTEPVLYYVRYYTTRWIPFLRGTGIDISPIIVIIVIIFLQSFLVRSMLQIAFVFR